MLRLTASGGGFSSGSVNTEPFFATTVLANALSASSASSTSFSQPCSISTSV